MKRKKHANLAFRLVKQDDLGPLATYIVDAMGKNAGDYAKPEPSLEDVRKEPFPR